VPLRTPLHRAIGIIHRPDELANPALEAFLALVRTALGAATEDEA
jgi:hypothetical protein